VLARLKQVPFYAQVLAGLVLGVVLGLVAREMGPVADGSPNWLTSTLETIGSSFVSLLRTLVVPLVITAIIASIANLRGVTGAARLAGQTLLWFAITALIAVSIGIGLGLLLQPGDNTSVTRDAAAEPGAVGDWWAFLTGLIPSNVLGLQASTSIDEAGAATTNLSFNVLQLLVIAIALGVAALRAGDAAKPFLAFNQSALAIVQKVLWWVIRLAPIGTVGLLGNAVASYGWDAIGSLGVFTAAIYAGLALVLFVVYPVLLRAHGLSCGAGSRRPGQRSSSPSSPAAAWAPCPSPSRSPSAWASRGRTPASPCRSAPRPRWTAARRSTRRCRRSSSRSSSASP
jgi:Na+/H+-dicarboxylate symporter